MLTYPGPMRSASWAAVWGAWRCTECWIPAWRAKEDFTHACKVGVVFW